MHIKKFDSINVVPFIDIMLVLLVIVLTTASFVAKGVIPVDLAQAKNTKKVTQNDTFAVTIKSDGTIYYNKVKTTIKTLNTKLETLDKKTPISISCDKNAKFESFVAVVNSVKQYELTNLHIITKK